MVEGYDPTDMSMSEIPDLRDEPWTVSIVNAGDHWQVHPGRGLLCESEWGQNVKRPWRMLTPWMMARYLLGVSYSLEFPYTERRLRKAVAACQMWCDRMNAYESRQRAIGERASGTRPEPNVTSYEPN